MQQNALELAKKAIIETSADAEDEGDGGLYPYDPTQTDIDIREMPQSVFELMRRYNDGRLIINPDFQRNLVWTLEQKSWFIESVILNLPLPPFYVNENRQGKYIVVDGIQRITTLYEFLNDAFALTSLQALPRLNGLSLSGLIACSTAYQAKIENKMVMVYLLKPSVPLQVVYDVFKRINTGGTRLERQEVRNCIFLGPATEVLKTLAESDIFRQAIDDGISPKRMKDREAVLRYLAFQLFHYRKDYSGEMGVFVDKAMREMNTMSSTELETLKDDFLRVMRLTYAFFGNRNFRIPPADKSIRGRVNIAVLESVGYFFSEQTDDFLFKHKNSIVDNFTSLLQNDKYLDAVQTSTGDKQRVVRRFRMARSILGNVQ